MKIRFEWDEAKAKINLRKHRVSFEIAARVFADPFAMVKQDRIENGEYRWQTLGLVDGFLLLLVAHTVHDDKDGIEVIRIISARRANLKERKRYEEEISL
ncbi:BrnT family toxin [Bartonella kosoyi]|uniref:BrnT family toxin n=1 Tax=Bartonella kosoyi TaxID=2133959 RepID=A0A5B9CXM7_9HYPH|nr:BrnT family toxin [Bartonella kosoyi]QEE09238.1 BrnT family toxin [Bartonella kosoyi]